MTITYTELKIPQPGDWQQIASGVFWVRMPLPFDLDHINLYLIADGDSYVMVDTGLGSKTTQQHWQALFDRYNIRLSKIIVTHMHPDHIGNAGFFTEQFKVPLLISHDEYFVARSIRAGSQGASQWQDREFLKRCGMSAEYIEQALNNRNKIQHVITPIPLSFSRLSEGQQLQIGEHQWQVYIGRGHSPEHVCLYCAALNVLISGDHVLPIISPNIGVYSTEPEANSLQRYLSTLPQFYDLPEQTLVLPAHKLPFVGLHFRVQELIDHHHTHLNHLLEFCREPRKLVSCLPVLFKRELSAQAMFFAVAECLSHLNYLVFAEALSRTINADGIYIYQTVDCAQRFDTHAYSLDNSIDQPLQT
ncbi:MBL fold metallo-hydrolase [Alteromonas sp. ASW11-36]|uniref:MBL fold metallo-hydrolase n=1 Tax=Alteromonas arenosi TaxID=3055817 RepID=A0ABT7ST49_9ALTE|nr:MBL fold metallo-hydrolase [Alteromonas sp. ASW11-36]MDM7859375.1 MBL fold metallo-hydrolase [Alteromonas sp. ASW11-36]